MISQSTVVTFFTVDVVGVATQMKKTKKSIYVYTNLNKEKHFSLFHPHNVSKITFIGLLEMYVYSRVALRVTQLFAIQRRILSKIYEKHSPRQAT